MYPSSPAVREPIIIPILPLLMMSVFAPESSLIKRDMVKPNPPKIPIPTRCLKEVRKGYFAIFSCIASHEKNVIPMIFPKTIEMAMCQEKSLIILQSIPCSDIILTPEFPSAKRGRMMNVTGP